MWYMFFGCKSLTSVNLSKFNIEKVTDMSYMFYSCPKLKYVDISSFTTNYQSVQLFDSLSNSGTIKIKREFYDKISSQIPFDWVTNFN